MFTNNLIKHVRALNSIQSSYLIKKHVRMFANLKFDRYEKSNDIFANALQKYGFQTTTDWNRVRQEVMDTGRNITDLNIDYSTIKYCIYANNSKVQKSYLKYMKDKAIKPNLATIGKLFKLYYVMYKNKLPEDKETLIFDTYNNLVKQYGILDSITNQSAIEALSITKHWKMCLQLLNEIKISSVPSSASYSTAIAAAFNNNCNEIAWKLMDEMIENKRTPTNETYFACLNKCEELLLSNNKDLKQFEEILTYLGNNDLIVSYEVINKIKHILKLLNIKCANTIISDKGVCKNCENKLPKIELSESEFDSLKKAFFDKVIIGKDVFRKTNPNELESFKDFISQKADYDVIVDGLNVAYSGGVKNPPHITSMFVAAVVQYFVKLNKKVLVLGRTHMNRWPRENLSYIKRHANVFLTQNLSQDDPYLLYCALNAGKNTIVVTRDLMRSHLYLLKNVEHKRLFSRWLTQSQYHLIKVLNNRDVIFRTPHTFVNTTQKCNNTWHIPFCISDKVDDDICWLCVTL